MNFVFKNPLQLFESISELVNKKLTLPVAPQFNLTHLPNIVSKFVKPIEDQHGEYSVSRKVV